MKHTILKKSILTLLLLALTACSTPSITSTKNSTVTAENNNSKTILIDVDKELNAGEEALRGKDTLLIDAPLYIGDNDEVSFKGEYLQKASPVKVKIGDNDEVSFTGDHYTIKTLKLHNGEIIQMQDKEGNTFVEVEVVK